MEFSKHVWSLKDNNIDYSILFHGVSFQLSLRVHVKPELGNASIYLRCLPT